MPDNVSRILRDASKTINTKKGRPTTIDLTDGKHTTAIVEDGERVLTPEQNKAYERTHPNARKEPMKISGMPRIVFDEGGVVDTDAQGAPTDDARRIALPSTDEPTKDGQFTLIADKAQAPRPQLEPIAADSKQQLIPDEKAAQSAAVDADRKAGAGKGINGIAQIGLANIHAKQLGLEPSISESTEKQVAPRKIAVPQDFHQDTAGGPLIGGAPTDETQPQRRDFAGMERKSKLADYDQRIQAARDSGDETTADKLALAKIEYQKNNPWGSEGNHPGILGKLGHVAAKIGNIAGDIVAPSTMMLIPGTAANQELRKRQQFGRIALDTENDQREAQANAKEEKVGTPEQQLIVAGTELQAAQASGDPQRVSAAQAKYDNIESAINAKNPKDTKTAPLSEQEIADYNQGFAQRWAVLHPQQSVPANNQLRAGATSADFDRLDKLMQQTETATGTKAQQVATNGLRQAQLDATKAQREATNSRANEGQLDNVINRFRAPYVASLTKLQGTMDSATAAAQDLEVGSPVGQAVGVVKTLSALASGQGSGVRITQAELNNLMDARIGGHSSQMLEKYFSGKSLTDAQVNDVHNLLADIQARLTMKEHVYNHGLNEMNLAKSPSEVKAIDNSIRKSLANIEKIPVGGVLLVDPNTEEPLGWMDKNGKRSKF